MPTQSLRSKTRIESDFGGTLAECPMWSFDGSSTEQADGSDSDCLLKPVAIYPDPDRQNAYLVMTEVLNADGTPHASNGRATIDDDDNDFWFGFEQEYFLWDVDTQLPPGFPAGGFPAPQGPYYCSVGAANSHGRDCVEEHFDICLEAGINHEGINAEVAKGQWEFQIFGKGSHNACDQVWVARYILLRLCEQYGVDVEWHCKPFKGDWNGSGMHCNFSTEYMRATGGKEYFLKLMDKFEEYKDEHIAAYGPDNHMRLTGLHETQSIDKFSWGVADRGASIRVPHGFVKDDAYKGYLEDRRPNSQGDPYKIVSRVSQTVAEVESAYK
jgi:glutamine synthetase